MPDELISTSWHSYPSIYALGHRALSELLTSPVLVEEKIDGSQFSFGRFDGELRCRSKGAVLNVIAPEKMFARGVEHVTSLPLHEGWTYRSEWLAKPKHNTLAYDRAPNGGVIIFDINDGHESYLDATAKKAEAERLGLETVPSMFEGILDDVTILRGMLDTVSVLGGQKIEGVVVKNYTRFGPDKKVLMGKFVSEHFKEVHGGAWREANPTSGDVILRIIEDYRTPARWAKAVQHLTEAGKVSGVVQDIGLLIKEVPDDILKECEAEIRDRLFEYAWAKIRRGVVAGMPQWYKERLLEKQFTE